MHRKLRGMYQTRYDLKQKCLDFFDKVECVKCGVKDREVLEFDHIDKTTKLYGIATMINQCLQFDIIKEELKKCQLLCCNCHKKKTIRESKYWSFMGYDLQ